MAKHPEIIDGIYYYCDRWCERCDLTANCMLYKLEMKKRDINYFNKDLKDGELVQAKDIRDIVVMARELIREFTIKEGVEVDILKEKLQITQQKHQIERVVKRSPMVLLGNQYLEMVDEWLNHSGHLFTMEIDYSDASKFITVSLKEDYNYLNPNVVAEAIETIRWYQHLISVKLSNALQEKNLGKLFSSGNNKSVIKDYNGLAKVALTGIYKSMKAWNTLMSVFSQEQSECLDIMVVLEKLQKLVKKEFPLAENFKRPGFDD